MVLGFIGFIGFRTLGLRGFGLQFLGFRASEFWV